MTGTGDDRSLFWVFDRVSAELPTVSAMTGSGAVRRGVITRRPPGGRPSPVLYPSGPWRRIEAGRKPAAGPADQPTTTMGDMMVDTSEPLHGVPCQAPSARPVR